MTTVILAEKPSQARDYASAFSKTEKKNGYIEVTDPNYFSDRTVITWGFGHLVNLAEPHHYKKEWKKWKLDELPILPEQFQFFCTCG
ncbi:DNA topoisomerase III [Geomicrobium sp. JCM 19037]|uniref:toprim domain-containing protein n=1 Tax=Geomicrobium sp. JCM 19037 TaxID=1460634 RepID=UPI00045F3257|nr:toprim domain-containing protein [Geomicrobium sp. JCM 19037]GAK04503.1 DNA topoisomerase III [Geomicrobium sp. JCM 19037]